MKKRELIFFASVLMFFILILVQIKAQEPPMPNVPFVGDINPETGLPEKYENFQKIADKLSSKEQNQTYLKQEWTKILAKNKIITPVLFYSDSFFSSFNPFWKIIFGIEFSWSWEFFFHVIIWIFIIILVYSSIKPFFELNRIFTLLIAFLVASLAGITKGINQGVKLLSLFVTNIWVMILIILIITLLVLLYNKLLKKIGKKYLEKMKKQTEDIRESKQKTLEKLNDQKLIKEGL